VIPKEYLAGVDADVEGQHYADVDCSGQLTELYRDKLPCVLISKAEHTAYHQLLHISETDELYRDVSLPRAVLAKSATAFAEARAPGNKLALRTRVSGLIQLYSNAYAGDAVLTTIARNVLSHTLSFLR
jgi:hypothetical protein